MSGFITQNRSNITKLYSDLGLGPDGITHFGDLISDQATYSFRSSVRDTAQDDALSGQVTYNPFLDTSRDSNTDRGHEFWTVKREQTLSMPFHDFKAQADYPFINGWKGPVLPYISGPYEPFGFPTVEPMSTNDIIYYGTSAIAQCRPTNPAASLSTFLGEIFIADRELPKVKYDDILRIQTGGGKLSDIGKGALNVQFAWLPFCNDLKKLMYAVKNSYKIMSQYKKDSGKTVRRRFVFPVLEKYEGNDQTYSTGHIFSPYPMQETSDSSHDATWIQYSRTEIWFEGQFTYLIPIPDTILKKFEYYDRLANRVLGCDFSAQTVWNLQPWSWLVDWRADIGSSIGLSDSMSRDNLVLRYGYLMRKVSAVNTLTVPGLHFKGSKALGGVSTTFSLVRKERHKATPYGFGINPEDLTPEQIAILVALGISFLV